MAWFIWKRTSHNPAPQVSHMAVNYERMNQHERANSDEIFRIQITEEQSKLPLDTLAKRFPLILDDSEGKPGKWIRLL